MDDTLLNKEQALKIAISLINGEKVRKDYGHSALKESELILKNIQDTDTVERELEKIVTNKENVKKTILDLEVK